MIYFNRLILSILIFSVFSCGKKESKNIEREIGYHENGNIKYTVPLINNLREGKLEEYYESGKIKGWSNWKKGKLDGESQLFYSTGSLQQKHFYIADVRCCKSEFFLEDGTLKEVQYLRDDGVMIDYIKYNKKGEQLKDVNSKSAIIISERDTLEYGDEFRALLRLGNREFDRIEAFLGDPDDKYILTNPKLEKFDSTTVILSKKEYTEGINRITGVVVEVNNDDKKELVVVPFEYSFFVKSGKTL